MMQLKRVFFFLFKLPKKTTSTFNTNIAVNDYTEVKWMSLESTNVEGTNVKRKENEAIVLKKLIFRTKKTHIPQDRIHP